MIRKNEIAVINVYLNGHQIDKVYSGQIQVYPDQQIQNTFWLKVTKSDNTVVYCLCRKNNVIIDENEYIDGFLQLDEIHATGYTTYFDTGYIPNINTIIECKIQNPQSKSNSYPRIYSTNGAYNSNGTIALDFETSLFVKFNGITGWTTISSSSLSWDDVYNTPHIFRHSNEKLEILEPNKKILYDRGTISSFYTSNELLIATLSKDSNEQGYFKYYYFKIYEGETLIHDYIPAKRVSDNICGFYDTVSNEFITSAGTQQFTGTSSGEDKYINNPNYNKIYSIDYSVIQSQITEPQEDYYELINEISIEDSSNGYDDLVTVNGKDPEQVYDMIPSIRQTLYKGYSFYGNELNDFSLSETTYRELLNRVQYDYKNVLVTDPVSDKVYETGGKYVTESVEMTDNPTIYYTDSTQRLQAYGNGEVKLYFMNTGNQVSNPYTVTRPMYNTNYNVYATAQEEGKLISDTVSQTISVSGYKTATPTITYNSNTFVVSASGNGTVLLYVDGVQVSNPYTLYQELTDTTYTVTATAQESGKEISYTRTQTCTVPAYQATPPTISFVNYLGQVSASGNGTVILYIDGIQVTNPYTLPAYGTYTATATSQETGRPISDTATKQIEYSESSFVATEYFWLEALEDDSVLAFNGTSELYYSADKLTWASFDTSITVNSGDRYYFKGSKSRFGNSSGTGTDTSNYFNLQTGKFKAGGNIMSMLYNDNFSTVNNVGSNQLRAVFKNCTALVEAPELPFMNLNTNCYTHMFNSCSNLTKAPEILPATTLYSRCYQWMFMYCTSLATAPVLPATNIHSNCYNDMFNGCTSLNWIKNMTLVQPSTSNSWNMMYNVSQQGTFVKNAKATWTTKNEHGCPSKWTIEYAEN